jgi:uncharacterized protein YdcH (DUF465 family)
MAQLIQEHNSLDRRVTGIEASWTSERERSDERFEAQQKLMASETGKQFDAMRSNWDQSFQRLREDFNALSEQMTRTLEQMEERLEARQEARLKAWAGEDDRGHARTLAQAVKAERDARRTRFWNRARLYGPSLALLLLGVLTAIGEGSIVAGFRVIAEVFAWG